MKFENKTFTVTCTMRERWIPHFLGMLKKMEQLGGLGGSRNVTLYSDGDGDYRPKFDWKWENKDEMPVPAKPVKDVNGDTTFDAG